MRDNDRERVLAGHLGRGFTWAFLVHFSLIFPVIVMAIMLGKTEEPDLEMRFEDVTAAELPDNLPPLDDVTAPEPLPRKPLPPRLVQRPATDIQAQPEKLEAPPEKEQAVAT